MSPTETNTLDIALRTTNGLMPINVIVKDIMAAQAYIQGKKNYKAIKLIGGVSKMVIPPPVVE